jgi:dihydrodipicolinate synthase/N-acetylneuraminate lyase
MLTRETLVGPWAGLPVAWTERDEVDEQAYRADVARCCAAGVPGVYTGGTTGEFYAMEFDEFRMVARATVEECRAHGTPAMVGCSSTYTLGAIRRAAFAAEIGADAVQVALPFWMEVDDRQVVPFFEEVAAETGDMALSVYETLRAKRKLTIDQHRGIRDAAPRYLMVKANAGTEGTTAEGCAALSDFINVFVSETLWPTLGPHGACGCCSAMVYWNPRLVLEAWSLLRKKQWERLAEAVEPFEALHKFLFDEFGARGFTDTAFDRLGGVAGGFLKTSLRSRGPYPSATEDDVRKLRQWYAENLPQMLET